MRGRPGPDVVISADVWGEAVGRDNLPRERRVLRVEGAPRALLHGKALVLGVPHGRDVVGQARDGVHVGVVTLAPRRRSGTRSAPPPLSISTSIAIVASVSECSCSPLETSSNAPAWRRKFLALPSAKALADSALTAPASTFALAYFAFAPKNSAGVGISQSSRTSSSWVFSVSPTVLSGLLSHLNLGGSRTRS